MCVTPHTGVWIETSVKMTLGVYTHVTPHTGVWIETKNKELIVVTQRHAPHGRVD